MSLRAQLENRKNLDFSRIILADIPIGHIIGIKKNAKKIKVK